MKEDFKNFIKRAKKVNLSESEKSILHSKISEFMAFIPIRGKMPVIREKNYLSVFAVRHFIKATSLVLILAVVIGGTGVSYAASNSLPGDALYNIKVNINEGIEEGLATTPEAKAVVQSKKVERRLDEAQTLAKENKLSPDNQKIVVAKIQQHVTELSKQIDILKENGDVSAALETTSNLTPVLEAHRDILKDQNENKDLNDKDSDTSNNQTLVDQVDNSIKEVQDQENSIIATVEDDAIESNATTTPTTATTTEEDINASSTSNASSTLLDDDANIRADKIATKKATKQVEEITNKISNIVEERINRAQEKIDQIKEEIKQDEILLQKSIQTKEEAQIKKDIVIDPKKTISDESIVENIVSIIDDQNASTIDTSSSSSSTIEVLPIIDTPTTLNVETPIDTFDVDGKIKNAEDMLHKAEKLLKDNKFKEALMMAQTVNKTAGEIEAHRKLKALDLTQQKTDIKTSTETASVDVVKIN